MNLILYSSDNCELCDKAARLVDQTLVCTDYQLVHINVTRSFELKKQYGLKIPVLVQQQDKSKQLYWPFDAQQILALVSNTAG